MTTTGRLELVALDAPDIEKLAAFYTELTGWKVVSTDDDWITVETSDGRLIEIKNQPGAAGGHLAKP